jgi:hypothetical protein
VSASAVAAVGFRLLGLQAATWAAIAVWVTLLVLAYTARFARRQVNEAARLRELQTRPWVVVYFDVTIERQFIHVVIENTGKTVATDVKVEFDPGLASSMDPAGSQVDFFRHVFPTLPPGARIDSLLDSAMSRFQSDLPTNYTATVTYGGMVSDERYSDRYILDLVAFLAIRHVHRKGMHDIAEETKNVADALKWVTQSGRIQVATTTQAEIDERIERMLQEQDDEDDGDEEEPPPADSE